MKRFYKFLMSAAMIMALTVPWQAQAQVTLTVADGTATDEYIPIYGYYVDEAPHSQFIYPASMLATMSGGTVTGMTFYLSTPATSAWGTTVTIKLMETTATTLSGLVSTTGATTVWTGTVNGNTSTWAVTFTAPYTYQGGNLLVDVNCSVGTYAHGYFTGVTQTGNTAYAEWSDGDDDYSAGFLPKTTLTYIPAGDDFCFSPIGVNATLTGNDVNVSWTDTNASSWNIVWGTGNFNPDTVTINSASSSTTSYQIVGLDEGRYTVYVQANCGDTVSSWAAAPQFLVGGCAITIDAIDSYGDGWNGGSLAVMQAGSTVQTIGLTSGSQQTYQVLVSGASPVSFVWTSGSFDSEVSINIYDGGGALLFTVSQPSAGSIYEMNVPCPSCLGVANLHASYVSSDSVTVNWTPRGQESEWLIYLNDSLVASVADTTYTFENLLANTLYSLGVRAVCSSDDSSAIISISQRTDCAPLQGLPYATDFESYTTGGTADFDPCWTLFNTYNSSHWPYVSSASNNKYLYMYMYQSSGLDSSKYAYAMLPPLDDALMNTDLELSFDIWGSSTASYGRGVIVALFDGGLYDATHPFDTVAVVMPTGTSAATATTQYVAISSQNLSGKRIGFFYQNQQGGNPTSYYCYIDNLSLHEAPNCLVPSNLHSTYVGPDTISLAWEDALNSGASYLVEYRPTNAAATDPWLFVEVTDTAVDLEPLAHNTTYEVRLSALCNGSDTSMSISGTYTTLAGYPINQFPYSCGFETYVNDNEETVNEASDWVRVNNTPNGWYVGTAAQNGGSKGLYISNDNGTSNAYTNNAECVSYAYATFHMEPGEYAFSFDWKANGESSWDFLRAAIAPYGTATPNSGWTSSSIASGFTVVDGGYMNLQSSAWQTKAGTFNITTEGNYNFYFVWRNDGSSGTNPPAAIDNFQINRNTCPQVTNLRATHVTADSIVVAWHPGQETSWVVSGDGAATSVNDTTYTFTNLTANTVYSISVRPVCDDSDTGMATIVSVRTECGRITVLPMVEDFESQTTGGSTNTTFIPCWHRLNNGYYYGYPYVSSSSTYNHTDDGTKGLYWYAGTTSTGTYTYGDYHVVVLPELDTVALPVNTTQISFWAKSSSSSYHPVFYVGVMTNPDSIESFQYYDTIAVNNTEWQQYTVMMNDFTGYGAYVAIRANRPTSAWTVYVDDIVLDSIPSCLQPTHFVATSTLQPDSVVLSWQEAGTATAWQLVVDTVGFDPTAATTIIPATTTSYTFTNLLQGVKYQAYVRANCGAQDGNSRWTGPLTFMPGSFEMGVTGGAIISMCDGAIYDDGGPAGKYSNNVDYTLTVYPTNVDSMLTFHGTAYTESSSDYLIIYEGEGTNGNQLWRTSTSTQLDSIPMDTSWAGPITLKFHTSASTVYNGFEVFVNCVAAPPCSAVEGVAAHATPSAAIVTWQPGSYGNYSGATVSYKADDDTTNTWITAGTTTETYFVITGLDPMTAYTARVSANCEGFNSTGVSVGFTTGAFACVALDSTTLTQVIDTIGNGTSTSSYFPYYTLYNYCVTQQIYTAEEVGHAGSISAIGFNMGTINNPTRTVQVFMGHTSSATSTSWLTSNLTQVYNGPAVTLTTGWNTINLTTPFNYNGNDNLVVVFRDNTGSWSSSNSVYGTNGASGSSLYKYRDDAAFDFSNMPTGTAGTFRMNLVLHSTGFDCAQFDNCAAPAPAVVNVTANTIKVAWAPGNIESSWEVTYRIAADTGWSAPVTVNTNSHTFTGLASGQNYVFKVRAICGDNHYIGTTAGTTLCVPISSLPYTEDFNHWGFGTSVHAPNCYTYGSEYNDSYPYINSSFSHGNAYGGSMYMYNYDNTNVGKSTWFALPMIDSSITVNQTQVVFNVFTNNEVYKHKVRVGVSTTPSLIGVNWIDTVTATPNQWTLFEVPLNSYTGTGRYVVIASVVDSLYSYPYVDDVTLEMIPTCLRPDSLTAYGATQNSVVLAWHERGGATNWVVEYGPRGFQPGTGTVVNANSNPFTLTGLPANYSGEYYVKAVCSANDVSNYSYMPFGFTTQQVPATLPYSYDFENGTEWNNWQIICNSDTNIWYRGTAVADSSAYSMYVSNNVNNYKPYIYNSKVNAAVYRDIDFGPVDSSYIMTFRARAGGTTSAGYDGLKVYLVDPSEPANPSNENIHSPWGDVRDISSLVSIRLDTTWQTYEIALDTLHGVHRVAFFWFNQNTASSYTHLQEAAAVDDIHIDYVSCPRPINLMAQTNITDATLGWQGAANGNYEVVYRMIGDTANTFLNVTTNSLPLSNLDPATDYVFWVRKICGVGDTSLYSDGYLFSTRFCDGPQVQNYTDDLATNTTNYGPLGYSYYNYGFVQTIIDSATLAGLGGDISHFAFHPATTAAGTYFGNMEVYMANVSESDLSTKFIVPDSTHQFLKVIANGTFNFTDTRWQYMPLDTIFTWDGHSNILVTVNRKHGSYASSPYASFYAHTYPTNQKKMRYVYTDNGAYDLSTLVVTEGTATNVVGDIKLANCGSPVVCEAPVIENATATETSATLTWANTAASYEVAIVQGNEWVAPFAGTPVSDTSYLFQNLTASTNYILGVRAVCGEGISSDWVYTLVTTDDHPCYAPTNVVVSGQTMTSGIVSWTPGEVGQNNFELELTDDNNNATNYTVTGTSYEFTGLLRNTTYGVRVRAICADSNFSPWSQSVTLHTTDCPKVTGVNVTERTSTTAKVTWTGDANAVYVVNYGSVNFPQGTGNFDTVTGTSAVITGLEGGVSYDVYVQRKCAEGVYGDWSDVKNFETLGIDDIDASAISLYPNPASSTVTLMGIEGNATVTVVDMNGRVSGEWKVESGKLTIDVSTMAKGAYFVRVTGEQVNAIRKLIVK